MITRRDMLQTSLENAALVALSPTVPTFLAQTARAAGPKSDSRILVVIQLDGGNDAINTLVPYADPGYAKNRKMLRLPEKNLIRVNDRVGLHPGLRDLGTLLDRGHLALVPGVGYPNPNRSHFESMAIWQTARLDLEEHGGPGWIGAVSTSRPSRASRPSRPERPRSLSAREHPLPALRGRRAGAASLERIDDLTLPAGWDRSSMAARLESQPEPDDSLRAYVRDAACSTRMRAPSGWESSHVVSRRCRKLSRHSPCGQAPDDRPAREGRPGRTGLLHVSIRL